MAIPSDVGDGATFHGVNGAAVSAAWPSFHTTGDISFLVLVTPNQAMAAPFGWVEIGSIVGVGIAGAAGSTGVQVFFQWATSSSMAATGFTVTSAFAGGYIKTYRGCNTVNGLVGGTNSPVNVTATSTLGTSLAAVAYPGGTTSKNNCSILGWASNATDTATNQGGGNPQNISLANVSPGQQLNTTDDVGGGVISFSGELTTAGSFTTTTDTIATASKQAYRVIAISDTGLNAYATTADPTPIRFSGNDLQVSKNSELFHAAIGLVDRTVPPLVLADWTVDPLGLLNVEMAAVVASGNISPLPASATASGATPTLTLGAVSVTTASPASATASATASTLTPGAVSVTTAGPAVASASGTIPTVVPGAVSVTTAAAALAAASGAAPALTPGAVSVTTALPASATGSGAAPSLTSVAQVAPSPATATASGVTPALTPGAVSVATAGPASATALGAAPTLTPGMVSINTANPAAAVASGSAPTLTAVASLSPTPASATASGADPSFDTPGTVQPSPAVAVASGATPALTPGSTSLSPAPALASSGGATPTLSPGSASLSPTPASAAATGAIPALTTGSTLQPDAALAVASGANPALGPGSVSAPMSSASAAASGASPTLTAGATSTSPLPASAVAFVAEPTWASGAGSLSPSPASAVARGVDPVLIVNGQTHVGIIVGTMVPVGITVASVVTTGEHSAIATWVLYEGRLEDR